MKLTLLGLTLAIAAAVPGGTLLRQSPPTLAVCAADDRTEWFRQELQVPTAVAMVPGMGHVRVVRHIDASCGCREGQLRCDLRQLASAEVP